MLLNSANAMVYDLGALQLSYVEDGMFPGMWMRDGQSQRMVPQSRP